MRSTDNLTDPAERVSSPLERLLDRYDASLFDIGRRRVRIRIEGAAPDPRDVLIEDGTARAVGRGGDADAELIADPETWESIASDIRDGMTAFRRGKLRVRRDLHLGVGFLAATAPPGAPAPLRIRSVDTRMGRISVMEAGAGEPVILVHGLGATKASFLPTIGALVANHRTIAIDLPGFGDSVKPLLAPYDARFFADSVVGLLDALELDRAHVVGNSMGGRVAIEMGLRAPERVGRLVMLAPSLAWLRSRRWVPYLRWVPTQLGVIQPAPRAVVERIVRHMIPGSETEWTAAGIDEFLRSYLQPSGRAAFYAAARNIYMEEPHGQDGFWTRLPSLQAPSLFVWGRKDVIVPASFARYVRDALPAAQHLELDCGHVPQLERPPETHDAIERFLGRGTLS